MSLLKQITIVLLFCTCLIEAIESPERQVQANVITSERDPKVRIELPKSVRYVGADRWVLYGIADCELHAFVEANGAKHVQRLYWVQFEGYVPTRPELKHTYDSPRMTKLGGMDFYVDTWVRPADATTQQGSDLEHIQALIRAKGYKLPAGMMSVRLVHLLDEQKRKELMIIYSEDVAPTGFTAPELLPAGKAHARWPSIEKGLIERERNRSLSLKGHLLPADGDSHRRSARQSTGCADAPRVTSQYDFRLLAAAQRAHRLTGLSGWFCPSNSATRWYAFAVRYSACVCPSSGV